MLYTRTSTYRNEVNFFASTLQNQKSPSKKCANAYTYGFNGKEKDDKGEFGDLVYDYGFRIYNPRIAKFLSVDPLTKNYPFYTPYQFASNSPIQAVDLDGLEGVQYLEIQQIDGKPVTKRVVEADVFVAISRNQNSTDFYSKKPEKDQKVLNQIIGDLQSEFIDNKFKDADGHDIIWKFNIRSFDAAKFQEKSKELVDDPEFTISGDESSGRTRHTGFILHQSHISNEVLPTDETEIADTENGNFNGFTITVNDQYYDPKRQRAHTLVHEVTHFFMSFHPDPNKAAPENTAEGHAGAGGGILTYGTSIFRFPGQIRSSSDEKTTVTFKGLESLSKDNVKNILESVPTIRK